MFFRQSKAKQAKKQVLTTGDQVSELAERAATVAARAAGTLGDAASQARSAAGPAARSAAHVAAGTLGDAAERLADAAERFANSETATGARSRFADKAESVAATVRPKKQHHRLRKLLIVGAVTGAIVGVVKSPLPGKLADKLFGAPPDDDEFDTITLPSDDAEALEPTEHGSEPAHEHAEAGSEDSAAH